MTPTQAQIEAAAKVWYDFDVRNSRTGATWESAQLFYKQAATFALTAAAEVGDELVFPPKKRNIIHPQATVNATIERCAQVAVPSQARFNVRADDAYVEGYNHGVEDKEAAIRALKDS